MVFVIVVLADEHYRVTLDVTSNGTIIHPLRFLFLDKIQLTKVLSKAEPLLPILIKDSKCILCPRALGAQSYQCLHILDAGALATSYDLVGSFHPIRLVIRLRCILDAHPDWVSRTGIGLINLIPPCELIENL